MCEEAGLAVFLLHLCESTFLYVWQQHCFSHRLQVSTVMASTGKDAFCLSIVMQTSVFLVVTASLKLEFFNKQGGDASAKNPPQTRWRCR